MYKKEVEWRDTVRGSIFTRSLYMWPFKKSEKTNIILNNPRYKDKPVLLLFEIFVLDVIGRLTAEKRKGIQDLNIKKIFNTKAEHWKPALREVLQLSNTIETAIQDSWITKLAENGDSDENIDPETFAREFADRYFKEDSKVDVWADGALESAKGRIEEYKKKGLLTIQTS